MDDPRHPARTVPPSSTSGSRKDPVLDAFVERFTRGMVDGFRRRFGGASEPAEPPKFSRAPVGEELTANADGLAQTMRDTLNRKVGARLDLDPDVGWVAWSPSGNADSAILGAIECAPGAVILDADDFLARLGQRIQQLVDSCDAPEDLADDLQRWLFGAGLYPHLAGVDPRDVGRTLIAENMAVRERLDTWGALPRGRNLATREIAAARLALDHDCDDPAGSLTTWAGMLSTLP